MLLHLSLYFYTYIFNTCTRAGVITLSWAHFGRTLGAPRQATFWAHKQIFTCAVYIPAK